MPSTHGPYVDGFLAMWGYLMLLGPVAGLLTETVPPLEPLDVRLLAGPLFVLAVLLAGVHVARGADLGALGAFVFAFYATALLGGFLTEVVLLLLDRPVADGSSLDTVVVLVGATLLAGWYAYLGGDRRLGLRREPSR